MNRKFGSNLKTVYRSMKGNTIKVKDMPSIDMQAFQTSIWSINIDCNSSTAMVIELKSNYRFNENQREYENYIETLNKALSKIQNNKSPGLEMIIGFWYKQ